MPEDRMMNVDPTGPDDDRLRDALRALPLATPPRSALPALQARLAARRRASQLRRLLPLAAAAAVGVLAVGVLLRSGGPAAPMDPAQSAPAPDPATSALIAQNRVFEDALRSTAFSAHPLSGRDALAGAELEDLIAMVDVALSAESDPEQARDLWAQRLGLMRELAALRSSDDGARPMAQAEVLPAAYRFN
jgi:hypothetical protein